MRERGPAPYAPGSVSLPPLLTGQAPLRRALLPIRTGERANDAAARAHHPWAEGRHRHGIAIAVHIQYRFVVARRRPTATARPVLAYWRASSEGRGSELTACTEGIAQKKAPAMRAGALSCTAWRFSYFDYAAFFAAGLVYFRLFIASRCQCRLPPAVAPLRAERVSGR